MISDALPAGADVAGITTRFGAATTLSRVLAAVAAVTGVLTFTDPGILHGPAAMIGSARGTGLVLAVLGAPALLLCSALARHGSARAVPVWLGASGYVTYNAVLLIFATPVNALFLLDTTLLGLSVATMVAVTTGAGQQPPAGRPQSVGGLRSFAVFIWVVAGLNTVLWLKDVVPGLAEERPAYLAGMGLTTNPVYAQDLALWLPLAFLTGWWLWRDHRLGPLLGGAFLAGWVAESATIAVDQWMGGRADPASTVASTSMTAPFLVLAVLQAVVLLTFLRRCSRT